MGPLLLTPRERALLRALRAELSAFQRHWPRAVPAELASRSRQARAAIARAHGVLPDEARFRSEPATGRMWIEVQPGTACGRAAAAARFAAAVDAFDVAELPLEMEPSAERRLRSRVARGGPVLVGERHGVEQNPLVAYTLLRRLDIRTLGLEWTPALLPAVEAFLAGGPLDPDAFAASADGRVTAGHLAVLRALRREGRLECLVLFDPPDWPESWSGRDRAMAERLLADLGGRPALAMAGSLHTRLRRHHHGVPLGAHLAAVRPGTVEMRLRYPAAGPLRWPAGHRCQLRAAGAWLELTVPAARSGVVPATVR
jgi:hypothetical protein